MHRLRILHISDIHLRGPREDADFRRVRVLGRAWNPSIPGDSDAWEENLAEVLADGPIDLVTFTGDLANWGAVDEYPRATRFFAHLSKRLQISTDRIFLVPGNHDIDRKVAEDAWTRIRAAIAAHGPEVISAWLLGRRAPFGLTDDDREQVLARGEAYRSWLAKDLGRPDLLPGVSPHKRLGYRATLADPRWPFPVQIIGLDSAWLAGDHADAGRLLLTTDQVGVLASDAGSPLPGFRLALVHHPLSMLADEVASRRTLCELGVSLLLRGHTHENDVTVVVEPGRALTQFAAGSLFEGDRGDIWQNAHLVIDAWLDDQGVPDHYDVRIRVWSREGFWHDDSGRYRAARGGRLRWPPASP